MLTNSQVCVVSNPYLVSLDELPNVEFIFDDLRQNVRKKGVPEELKKFRKENNLRRLTRTELSAVLNRIAQTKETKKYIQSESLRANYHLKKAREEKEIEE